MKLNNVWGYGQIFGFSGLDGECRFLNDCVATLTRKKIGFRFELTKWVKVLFPVKGRVSFSAITGDMIDAKTKNGEFFIAFDSADSLVGYTPILPIITGEDLKCIQGDDALKYTNGIDSFVFAYRKMENGLYKFALSHSEPAWSIALFDARKRLDVDVEKLKKQRYDYFKKMPKCKDKRYERLYYKALSVNKVNVKSKEGNIPCRWTTPDRVPHRRMWLWDSAFHAIAMATYDTELAKDALRAVFSLAEPDGFISCMMNPYGKTRETQPQVLAWATWNVYKKCGDKEFLQNSVDALNGYLTWDKKNRDRDGNGLLEWVVDYSSKSCRGGESGLDNSPRFDATEVFDAVDFSLFQANDSLYLSYIYNEIGNKEKAEYWKNEYERIKSLINEKMWCEEDGLYYDRFFSGEYNKTLTHVNFLPLFANIASKEQAEKLVKRLVDPNHLWLTLPVASTSKQDPNYGTDMWRGSAWLNINYMIIKGLKNYGYDDVALELKERTLKSVNKWYKKTGAIFEHYDSSDKTCPYMCDRKMKARRVPDLRKQVHSIIDFNWSACFTLLLIQDEYYQ